MNILVAGGLGYVGSRLTPALIERGHTVKVVDKDLFGSLMFQKIIRVGSFAVRYVVDDVFKLKIDNLEGYDCVVWLAGLSNDPMANLSPAENYIQNSAAPAYVAYIAKKAGVKRFVYASTCSVYGYTGGRSLVELDMPLTQEPYGLSKLAGEKAVLQLSSRGFSVIALRKGTISGPSPRMRFDLMINTMFKDARTQGYVRVNNGVIHRPILGIDDAVAAYILAIESEREGIFNIASANHDAEYIGRTVADMLGVKCHVNFDPESRSYKVDWSKAKRELGFTPVQSVASIVRHLEEVYEGVSKQFFERDEHYNIRVWRKLCR